MTICSERRVPGLPRWWRHRRGSAAETNSPADSPNSTSTRLRHIGIRASFLRIYAYIIHYIHRNMMWWFFQKLGVADCEVKWRWKEGRVKRRRWPRNVTNEHNKLYSRVRLLSYGILPTSQQALLQAKTTCLYNATILNKLYSKVKLLVYGIIPT